MGIDDKQSRLSVQSSAVAWLNIPDVAKLYPLRINAGTERSSFSVVLGLSVVKYWAPALLNEDVASRCRDDVASGVGKVNGFAPIPVISSITLISSDA